jgi:cobalamin-dependent methionine synthase I
MTKKELRYEDLGISLSELYEQMGYEQAVPDEATVKETDIIIAEAKGFLRPRFSFFVQRELPDFAIGKIIERQLKGAEAYAFFICTAGVEYEAFQERLKKEGDMVRVFIADALGSVIAEKAADQM